MTALHASALLTMGLGGCLLLLGRWGRGERTSRVQKWRTPEDRLHAAAVLRRGARACLVIGVLLIGAGLAALVSNAL